MTVSIEDTGPGISGEIRGELFQPFASFGKKSGLGLGLALSRETVLDHGGDIWADAAFQGGARFCAAAAAGARRDAGCGTTGGSEGYESDRP